MAKKKESDKVTEVISNSESVEPEIKPKRKFHLFHRKLKKKEDTEPYVFADSGEDISNSPHTRRKINWSTVLSTLAVVLVIVLVIGPGIVGYSIYGEDDSRMDDLSKSVENLNAQIGDVKKDGTLSLQLQEQVSEANDKFVQCSEDKVQLEGDLNHAEDSCDDKIDSATENLNVKIARLEKEKEDRSDDEDESFTECVADLGIKDSELEILQEKYNAFTANVARSICCIKKFDNPSINGYDIRSNKMVCLIGEGTPLDCSFD